MFEEGTTESLVADLVDEAGWKRHTTFVVATVWATWFMLGWSGYLTSFLMEAAGNPSSTWASDGQAMTTEMKSSTLFFAGVFGMGGNLLLGVLSDRYGRTVACLTSMAFVCFAMGGFLTAQTNESLSLVMMLTPFSRDGVASITGALLAEWVPSSKRGVMLTLCHGAWNLGRLGITLWWTTMPPIHVWHQFVLGAATIPIVLLLWWALFRRRLESPRWFCSHRDVAGLASSLRSLDIQTEIKDVTDVRKESGLAALWEWALLHKSIVARLCTISALNYSVHGSLSIWFIIYLERTTPTSLDTSLIVAPIAKITATLVLSGGNVIERLPRRTWMVIGLIGSAVTLYLHTCPQFYGWVTWIVCFREFCAEIIHSAWGLYLTETFPTRCRTTGIGAIALVGHIGTILGTSTSGTLMDRAVHLPVYLWSASLLLTALLAITLPRLRSQRNHM